MHYYFTGGFFFSFFFCDSHVLFQISADLCGSKTPKGLSLQQVGSFFNFSETTLILTYLLIIFPCSLDVQYEPSHAAGKSI